MGSTNKEARGLTKNETVALWHAVDNLALMVRQMPKIDGISAELIAVERGRLTIARRALRKVNELRKQGL